VTTSKWGIAAPGGQHPLMHGLAFVFSGTLAFVVDAGILQLLTAFGGLHPIVARIGSLPCAQVTGWLSHRRFTFRLTTPPTFAELLRYLGVQSTVALINYGIFALIVLMWPAIGSMVALIVSCLIGMFFSYFGIRFAAFRLGQSRGGDGVASRSRPDTVGQD
jgi:putative flippase GtrA